MTALRPVLLDNEAVQALLDPRHRRHRSALVRVQANVARSRREHFARPLVPTAVRVEAGWDRQSSGAAGINRLRAADVPLDGATADRAARIGAALRLSVADAHLAAAIQAAGPCTVITSDVDDVRRIAAHLDVRVNVVAL